MMFLVGQSLELRWSLQPAMPTHVFGVQDVGQRGDPEPGDAPAEIFRLHLYVAASWTSARNDHWTLLDTQLGVPRKACSAVFLLMIRRSGTLHPGRTTAAAVALDAERILAALVQIRRESRMTCFTDHVALNFGSCSGDGRCALSFFSGGKPASQG